MTPVFLGATTNDGSIQKTYDFYRAETVLMRFVSEFNPASLIF
jgi:hypothetical protein